MTTKPKPKPKIKPRKVTKPKAPEKTGRKTQYLAPYAKQAERLCKLGATNQDLADFFEVQRSTIWRWGQAHPAFLRATVLGKGPADDRVEMSLYHRAVGYSYEAVKIFLPAGFENPVIVPYMEHVPPDISAIKYFLKNRRPEQWRDKLDHVIGGDPNAPIQLNRDAALDYIEGQLAGIAARQLAHKDSERDAD